MIELNSRNCYKFVVVVVVAAAAVDAVVED